MSDGLDPDLLKWLDGKFEALANKIDDSDRRASDSRRDVYQKLEEQRLAQLAMRHDLENVKRDVAHLSSSVDATKPTLAEFANWKAQAVGAGKFGRFLWVVGAGLLVFAAWLAGRWEAITTAFKALGGR